MPLTAQLQGLVTLLDAGHFREVEAAARDLVAGQPQFGYGWKLLALAIHGQGGNAVEELRMASRLLPKDYESHLNLGQALMQIGQPKEAMRCYRRALKLKPDDARAHCGLGNAQLATGKLDESVLCQRRALSIDPGFPLAHYNLGNALQKLGKLPQAESAYRRAVELAPRLAQAHYNLGNALHDLGRLGQALESFRRALEIDPGYLDAYSNLLLTSLLSGEKGPADMLAEARRFGEFAARQATPFTTWRNVPDPGRCLRIGFVSGDFRNHPVGYFVQAVLSALASGAAGRIEVYAYHNNERTDALSDQIRACCRGWQASLDLSDQALAQKIRDDGIDVLFDLSGHTALSRLAMFAWRPAPIQVTWLGYMGTTGLAAIDYLLADPWTLPESEEAHFSEKIWRLPETYVCFTAPREEVPVGELPARRNGCVTFGSFNNLNKLNDAVVALWARVLERTPASRLLLKAKQFEDASVRQSVAERFGARGVDPARLTLKGHSPSRGEHLADYRDIDIALDPFPYPGITTSVEGLWMGVPLLTLAGERFQSRQGMGLLTNAGLARWIAADKDDYVAKSAAYAADLESLAALRAGLRQSVLASPLFDAPRFARHFEAALRAMWKDWCGRRNLPGQDAGKTQ